MMEQEAPVCAAAFVRDQGLLSAAHGAPFADVG